MVVVLTEAVPAIIAPVHTREEEVVTMTDDFAQKGLRGETA